MINNLVIFVKVSENLLVKLVCFIIIAKVILVIYFLVGLQKLLYKSCIDIKQILFTHIVCTFIC